MNTNTLIQKTDKKIEKIRPAHWITGIFIVIALILISGAWYSHYRFTALTEKIDGLSLHLSLLEGNLSSTTLELQGTIARTHDDLADAIDRENRDIKKQLNNFEDDVDSITGTVSTLEKLRNTDPELLQKYSKVFFLNEHYSPPRLAEIPDEYEYIETRTTKIHAEVWPYLEEMLEDAADDDVLLYVSSAFRSFNEQSALKGQYSVIYGAGTANQFSADQGYSEHQLGTTIDLLTNGIGGVLEKFDTTPAFQWMKKNAHKYGFVLSYPQGNAYYVYEPWHWRFVGVKLATDLNKQGKGFYDLDQREIDEYLVDLFD